jgi:hypothetical protein
MRPRVFPFLGKDYNYIIRNFYQLQTLKLFKIRRISFRIQWTKNRGSSADIFCQFRQRGPPNSRASAQQVLRLIQVQSQIRVALIEPDF